MTEKGLHKILAKKVSGIINASVRIEQIYYCAGIDDCDECRNLKSGMGFKAKQEFPNIDFSKSILVGDSISEMKLGKKWRFNEFIYIF